jgi:hypothetical protein
MHMSWSVQIFRLVSSRTDSGLFCGKDQLTLGGQPLLIRTDLGLSPLPLGNLQQVFDAAYGVDTAIDAVSRLPCLQSIARALDASDLSYAAMLSLMLRLPEIDTSGMLRLRQMDGTPIGKYDDNEDRDQRGRWTSGGGQSSPAASKPVPSKIPANTATAQGIATPSTGRWPDKRRENPNIVPAQVGLPIPFPPLIPGGSFGSPKPKDDGFIFPPFTTPQSGTGQAVNDKATIDARTANDNKPRTCPDPSFEASSIGRTPGQLLYQSQISGLATGMGVRLNGVDFDGCRESDGTMLEAKTTGPWFFRVPDFVFRGFDEYKDVISQAFRQMYAAGSRKIEWHFSNPRVADFWEREFTRLNYRITVKYTPFIPATVKLFTV